MTWHIPYNDLEMMYSFIKRTPFRVSYCRIYWILDLFCKHEKKNIFNQLNILKLKNMNYMKNTT
jgi:hypothetical protein